MRCTWLNLLFLWLALGQGVAASKDRLPKSSAEICSKHKPSAWLQLGIPRTATTLQAYTMILVAKRVCHGDEVSFQFIQHTNNLKYMQSDRHSLEIIKTHNPELVEHINGTVYLFVSASNEVQAQELEETISKKKPTVVPFVAVQLFNDVHNGSYRRIAEDYAPLFNLTDKDVIEITTLLDKWSILRMCCGPQMSRSWRQLLWLSEDKSNQTIGKELSIELPHPCSGYTDGLRSVEEEYRSLASEYQLPLFEQAAYVGQCQCSIKLTQARHLHINHHSYHSQCKYKVCKNKCVETY